MRATIGVDIGATKIACGVLKEEQFLSKTTIPTPKDGWRSVLDSIVNTIRSSAESAPRRNRGWGRGARNARSRAHRGSLRCEYSRDLPTSP